MLIKNKKGLIWRTMQNELIHTSQMETSHLFNSVKMMYNHMAELIGFPTFWFNNKYGAWTDRLINKPEESLDALKTLVLELEDRTDWNENQKNTYMKIRLTLSGEFHKIVFDELNKRGIKTETMELETPLKLLMEAKDKYERKQLTSSN